MLFHFKYVIITVSCLLTLLKTSFLCKLVELKFVIIISVLNIFSVRVVFTYTSLFVFLIFQYKVTVQKMGAMSHLCSALSQLTHIPAEKVNQNQTVSC